MKYRLVAFCLLFILAFHASAQDPSHSLREGQPGYEYYDLAKQSIHDSIALYYADKLEEIARIENFPLAEVYAYVVRRRHYVIKGDIRSLACAEKEAELGRKYGYSKHIFDGGIAAVEMFYSRGNILEAYKLALQYKNEAVDLGNDPYGLALCNRVIARMYKDRGDYQAARMYFNEIIKIEDKISSTTISYIYTDLANSYEPWTEERGKYLTKALEVCERDEDKIYIYGHLLRMFGINNDRENFMKCCHAADSLISSSGYSMGKPYVWTRSLFTTMFDGDIKGVQDALSKAKPNINNYYYGYCAFKNLGLDKDALDYYVNYNEESRKKIASASSYDLIQLDKAINESKMQAQLDREKAEATERLIVVSSLFLFIVLSIIIFFIAKRNKYLTSANKMKTHFIQNISHEIRTPLNAIVGFSELLAMPDGTLTPDMKEEYFGHVKSSSELLLMLMDDIIVTSDIESGNFRLIIGPTKCNDTARKAIGSVTSKVPSKVKLSFTSEVDDSFEIKSDDRRIRQVLINLLTNACKNTTEGEIRVHVSTKEKPGFVSYSVTDTGRGIPADKAEEIFERFRKLDYFKQGAGLGLSICRDICDKLGGSIYLDTSYTGGARFVLNLPA